MRAHRGVMSCDAWKLCGRYAGGVRVGRRGTTGETIDDGCEWEWDQVELDFSDKAAEVRLFAIFFPEDTA